MKRVITLDILRGIAIFVVILTHAFYKCVDFSILNPADNPVILFVILAPFILLGKWKSFFVMISAAAHLFTLDRDIKSKKPTGTIITVHIVNSLMLLVVAYLFKIILLSDMTLPHWIFTGVWDPSLFFGNIQFSDMLELIAISRIINTLIYLSLTRKNGINRPYRNMIILGILAGMVILLTPVVVHIIYRFTGFTPDNIILPIANTSQEMVKRMIFALLIGQYSPLFPFLSSAFVGGILGILFNQESLSKQKTLRIGYSICLSLVVLGILLLPLSKDLIVDIWNQIHSSWELCINLGLQLWCVLFLMSKIEFNPNNAKLARRLRYFHRLGLVSLTVFTYEFFDLLPRLLISQIFHVDLLQGRTTSMLILFVLVLTHLLYWTIIIRVWEFLGFYGTIEVMIKLVNALLQHQKFNFKDPLKIHESLYQVEPVYFHESSSSLPLYPEDFPSPSMKTKS